MAIYHLHVKNISRGNGRSIVAAAAYRAGETLPNEGEERLSAFGGRRDVLYAEIRVPLDAPAWAAERAQLWNAAEAAERRKDARLAKEIEIALPRDLPRPTWLRLARAMADIYTAQGFVADLAIHDDGSAHNPHVHILLTTRVLTESGFGPKIREADGLKFVTDARKSWETLANEALTEAGLSGVDARSHAAAGVEQIPKVHRGPHQAERRARRAQMDEERTEAARQDLLNVNPTVPHPFPHLLARSDWPPLSRQEPSGMTPIEQAEFQMFWEAVDARQDMLGKPRGEHDRGPPVSFDPTLPVPGPDRRPISQEEQRRAEDAMIGTVEGKARRYQGTLYAETVTTRTKTSIARRWQTQSEETTREAVREDDRDNRWTRGR